MEDVKIIPKIDYSLLDEYLELYGLDRVEYYRDIYINNLPVVNHKSDDVILLHNVGGVLTTGPELKILDTDLGVLLRYKANMNNDIILAPLVILKNKYPEVIGFYLKN